jgi:23S rRNA (cytidine1920-2'-O)/16S rRNA (cytidine1409-2'-O)-methyltransferase
MPGGGKIVGMAKKRLDVLMVEKGLVESRSLAQRLVMAGKVRIHEELAEKPSLLVLETAEIRLIEGPPYVSRGGEKLVAALDAFGLNKLDQWVCADIGSSTGGFTDCLLQHGAARVYAIDVGYGVLHWKLRQDERVVVMERTNARYVTQLAEPVNMVTIDASFISLRVLLPVAKNWFGGKSGCVICLIKPQFEAGRKETAKGAGIIRDPVIHREVIEGIIQFAESEGYSIDGVIRSPLTGPKGNVEFLVSMKYPVGGQGDWSSQIARLFAETF